MWKRRTVCWSSLTRQLLSVLVLLTGVFCVSVCSGLEGTIFGLREFDGNLVTESYRVPHSAGSEAVQYAQPLTGDLAGFSLQCESCDGTTRLTFQGGLFHDETAQVHVILSDRTLSVLVIKEEAEGNQVKLTEVLPLNSHCRPQYLLPFSSSPAEFAVICDHMALHFATLLSNLSISLGKFSDQCSRLGGRDDGVLFESASSANAPRVKAVSLFEDYTMDVCNVNGGVRETPELPHNVNCINNTAEFYPLHTADAFLLQCMTHSGATLYIINVPKNAKEVHVHGDAARSIEVDGRPLSSPNGTFIVVVDNTLLTAYVTDDDSVPGKAKGFSGHILTLEFLNDHTVLVLTDYSEHSVIDLRNSSLRNFTYYGTPLAWTWVDQSSDYIFVSEKDGLYSIYIVNAISTKPKYEVKEIANQPEMIIFLPQSVKHMEPPPTTSTGDGPNIAAIVGGVIGVLVLLVLASVVSITTVVAARPRWRRYFLSHAPASSTVRPSVHMPAQVRPGRDNRVVVHIPSYPNPLCTSVCGGHIPPGDNRPPTGQPAVKRENISTQGNSEAVSQAESQQPLVDQIDNLIFSAQPRVQGSPEPSSNMAATINNYLAAAPAVMTPEESGERQQTDRTIMSFPPVNTSCPVDSSNSDRFSVAPQQEQPKHAHVHDSCVS